MIDEQPVRPEGVRLPSLAVSDALRATFSLYRRHFWTFVLVMAVVAIPSLCMTIAAEAFAFDDPARSISPRPARPNLRQIIEVMAAIAFNCVLGIFVVGFFDGLSRGASISAASDLARLRATNVTGTYRVAVSRFGWIILADLAIFGSMLVLVVTCLGILALPYVMLGLWFVTQAVIIERLRPLAAIRRSWQLAQGHRIRILLCELVITGLVSGPMVAAPYGLHWWTGVGEDSPLRSADGLFAASALVQIVWVADHSIFALGKIFLWPLHSILTTVLYLDLLAREAPYRLSTRRSDEVPPQPN